MEAVARLCLARYRPATPTDLGEKVYEIYGPSRMEKMHRKQRQRQQERKEREEKLQQEMQQQQQDYAHERADEAGEERNDDDASHTTLHGGVTAVSAVAAAASSSSSTSSTSSSSNANNKGTKLNVGNQEDSDAAYRVPLNDASPRLGIVLLPLRLGTRTSLCPSSPPPSVVS